MKNEERNFWITIALIAAFSFCALLIAWVNAEMQEAERLKYGKGWHYEADGRFVPTPAVQGPKS